jgi:hypothetical protein
VDILVSLLALGAGSNLDGLLSNQIGKFNIQDAT